MEKRTFGGILAVMTIPVWRGEKGELGEVFVGWDRVSEVWMD